RDQRGVTLDSLNPRQLSVVLVVACAVACSRGRTAPDTNTRPQPPVAASPPVEVPAPPQAPAASGGESFDREARQLFRIAACAGNEPVPDALATAVEAHCALFQPALDT